MILESKAGEAPVVCGSTMKVGGVLGQGGRMLPKYSHSDNTKDIDCSPNTTVTVLIQ